MTGPGIVLALLYLLTALSIFSAVNRYQHPEKVKPYNAGTVVVSIVFSILISIAYTYLAVS